MALSVPLLLLFVLASSFLLIHGTTRPWWKTWEGRALIASSLGWSLVSGGFLLDRHGHAVSHDVWVTVAWVAAGAAALKLWFLVDARYLEPRRSRSSSDS